ncbi:hypothetical protein HBHAL_5128 [Halobacillus halophilus DSM 2266]|uniref:Uncharacterized protein n=1 Tax=Halobacillus halophilus (strain ATCC 35676 / DSM 2266 / JCM 20832 / KCTC 3685 / LMG 17431 / NBRC 102448 / NCIMB 2269) TaxID=866895 RepID=I0JTJ1_HALH3|nr:hypothetical protein HBHAL_5128 [Halobacillus halophilus DSM 2266]
MDDLRWKYQSDKNPRQELMISFWRGFLHDKN